MLRPDIKRFITENSNREAVDRMQQKMFTVMEDLQSQLTYEPEMQGWTATGGGTMDTLLGGTDLRTLRRESLRGYYRNPHARVVIRNLVKFIIGGGSIIDFRERDETKLTAISDWWRAFTKKVKWFRFQREFITRAFRDGDVYVRKFVVAGEPPTLRFIDPDRMGTGQFPDGIETNKTDAEEIIAYHYRIGSENIQVPADEMHHTKIDVDGNVKHGHPILESILTDLGEYRQWRKARMVLNIVRTSVALVKEVTGSPNDLSRLRLNQKAVRQTSNETDKQKMLRPGTIIQGTAGVTYKMLSANLDAKDAAEDGETILRAVASGSGFPDVFVTGNYSNSNYASTIVSQNPAIREFEDWGHFFIESFVDIIDWVLNDGVEQGEIFADTSLDFDMTFPPIIRRDLAQENTAYQVMNQAGALSKRTWQTKMGFNPDQEQKAIEEEGGPASAPSSTAVVVAPKRVEDRQPRSQVQA